MIANSLVRPLFEGPIDVVGDIHGEIDAAQNLLANLGYAPDGTHPKGRRLIFLGDLTDRGPDSPGVVQLVERLVKAGRAQCVLGNHDLNLLLGERKHENWWFFGERSSLDASGTPTPAILADVDVRQSICRFFRSLPLVLERPDVRVVHACWDDSMVECVRQASGAVALHRQYEKQIDAGHQARNGLDEIDRGLDKQNHNPVKVLTSGLERRCEKPFESGGKLRHEERVPWWDFYRDEVYCIFGHYGFLKGKYQLTGRAICADFAVGKRWQERKQPSFTGQFEARLGAFRLPEKQIIFDDGETEDLNFET
jgi:hypothetical protein